MPDGSGAIWDRHFGKGHFTSRIEASSIGFLVERFWSLYLAILGDAGWRRHFMDAATRGGIWPRHSLISGATYLFEVLACD